MSIKRISIFFFLGIAFVALASIPTTQTFKLQYQGQTLFSGQNVNMVSGTSLPDGDPWLQRQNEPSIAVSTRNPLHLLAGANDYRTVDIPGDFEDQLPGKYENSTAGDAWLGIFKSFDGGQSWISTLLPGYPQDTGSPSPIHGYQAAADPVVRAGANGLFYYSGIAFNRGDNETGAVFIARYIDNNNDDETDTIQYLDTTIIDMENGGRFKDKPWIAVDAPRKNAGTVSIDGQSIPRHNVYIVYTVFTESGNSLESKMLFRRSTDCGQSWEAPIEINGSHILNQGATIAVDPRLNGHIMVAWRRFSAQNQGNAIIAARSTNEGVGFSNVNVVAEIDDPFDQGTSSITFRTNSYPTLAIDDKGIIYLAWAQQAIDPAYSTDSRIVISTSKDAISWTAPAPVEFPTPDQNTPNSRDFGHQFKPSITFGSGKLMMVWYDTRNDYCLIPPSPTIDDHPNNGTRHTIDVRVAQADPGENPIFDPSIQVSRYLWALSEDYTSIEQVQFNPPNYPLFKGGTVPFHGDYIDIALSPSFIRNKQGNWIFNTEPIQLPKFHIAWVDNRDVRPPEFNDWTDYTPPSKACADINLDGMGMRNQNVYTSRITTALEVGTPRNSKKLGTLGYDPVTGELIPRTFVIYVKNTTGEIKSFRLKITEGPQYGEASFLQNESLDELDVEVAPYSSISRPVFVTSTSATDTVTIEVFEIDTPGGSAVSGGLASSLILNPDPSNPGDDLTKETRNPNIINPNIINWDVLNPNIINPNIINSDIINPNIINPNIINPNIINPNIINEPLEDASITDVQWRVENLGNTSSSYTFKIFAKDSLPAGIYAQLLIYKVHYTPGADPNAINPCELKNVQSHELITNIINPNIINPNIINPNIINPNIINSSIENATFYLRPGEEAVAVLRLVEPQPSEVKTLESGGIFKLQSWTDNIGAASTAQAPDSGEEEPEVSSTDLLVLTSELDPATVGSYYIVNLLATGGDGTYTWSMNPNYLPPGLIYKTNGTISGTPTKDPNKTYPFIYSFLVQVASAGETNTQTVSITVNAAEDPTPPLNIQTTALGAGTIGSYYGATLKAVGGKPPYSWSKFSGTLPIGLTLDSGGNISGTILADPNVTFWPHVYNFTVKVTDSMGGSDTQALMITVNAIPPKYWKISGYIRDDAQPPNPLSGVILYGLPGAPTTDFYGYYETSVREGDSFIAEPFKSGCTFNPANRSYTKVAQDWANEHYTGSLLTYSISGFVTADGVPLPGVVLSGLPGTPETDIDGYYQGTVPHEWTGTVTPTLEGFSFSPSSITYESIVSPLADQNFTAVYTGGDVDDAYEDNDNLADAYPVQPGIWTNLRSMDEDWYVVNIPQSGDDLSVQLTGILDVNIDLALYDSLGNMIMEAISGQEYESVYAANLTAGDYYIRIPPSWQSVLPYSLSIETGDLNLGTISGQVTDEESNGLHVRVNIFNDFASWNTFSDSNGNYSLGLPPGEYRVLFDPEGTGIPYLWKYYINKLNGPAADWITVSGGVTTAGIDAQLEAEGAISGAVTDPGGQPVTEAVVWAWSPSGSAYRRARTDSAGNYRIGYLRTRNYRVSVSPDLEHLAFEWYSDHYSFDSADPVHVDAGSETSGIDIQLDEAGYISGRVTDSTGIGIKNLSVRAHDISGLHLLSRFTDEQGNYTIPSVPATDVKIYFNPGGLDYIPEWYNNKSFFEEEVDLVPVQVGQTTTGINAQLAGAGSLSGKVTDTQGNPLESIEVHVWDFAGNLWKSSKTDRYGKYTVNKLPAGPMKVRFRSPYGDYATEWYENQTSFSSAGTVTVAANHTATGIDAQLAENGGHITGTVTNSGGQGIEGVCVLARDSSIEYAAAYTFTDASGNFNIPRLPTSQYKVHFDAGYNWLNHTSEYYDNKPDYAQANLVSVTAGQIRSGINAVLDECPPLNILTASLPDGLAGESYFTVLEAAGGQPMYSWTLMPGEVLPQGLSLDANGIISGIPVVQGDFTFNVQVIDSAFAPQTDIQSIAIHISQYGGVGKEISGRITSNGAPVQGVVISGFPNPPATDANGFYTALVPLAWEGTVTPTLIEFSFNPASRTYTPIAENISEQNYEAMYTGGGTDDDFEENDDINSPAFLLSGTTSNLRLLDDDWYVVTVPSGEDLKVTADGVLGNDIDVAVYDSAGNQIIETVTGPKFDTVYVDGGSGGDFKIHIRYFWEEGLQNIYSLTVETAPSFGTGVITGTVTDEVMNPIQTDVWVYHDVEGWLWRTISDTNGIYTINLPPDEYYKVWFSTVPRYNYNGTSFLDEMYANAISTDEAIPLTVLSGQTLPNIDAQLALGGSISGHIDDGYGNPGWAQILVYDYKQAAVASGNPDENGNFLIERIPPGNYKIRFRPDWNHATQWSGGQNSYAEAHPVPVHAGQITTGIDIQLGEAGYLHGRVTDTFGNPIQGIIAYAYDESTFYTGMGTICSNQTDENGEYWLGRLPTSNIKLYFYTWEAEESYVTEIYDNKSGIDLGDPIAVVAGETTDLEAVELEAGGIFSGRVTDSQGEGIRNVLVWPFQLDNHVVYYNYQTTDEDGFYSVKGVPSEVKIRFRPYYYGDKAVQWYDGKGSYSTADILPVPPGETVTDIDAQMPENGGKITGRVTNSSGTGIGGVLIHVYDTELEAHYTSAYTDANGYYTVRRLPTCKVKLHFDTDYRNLNYISEYYNDKITFAGATQVQANLGKTTANINVVLSPRPGLAISTTGLPAGSVAQEYGATIQATGGREYYHFSLLTGSLPNGLTLNSNGDISGVPTQSGTFNFTVEATDSSQARQSVTRNLSITIDPYAGTGFLISGTVNENGSPLPNVEMGGLPGNPLTNAAGQYSVIVYPGWNGTVTPNLEGYAFTPASRTYSQVDQNYVGQDYEAGPAFTIRGAILIDGTPLDGVLLSGLPGEVRTDENGNYGCSVLSGWTGTVTPTLPGFTFDPPDKEYTNVAADFFGQDYEAAYVGGGDDAYENNDDWMNAAEISLGMYTDLVLLDFDWFKFNISSADAGKDLKIHFKGTSYPDPNARRDLDFIVLDGSGKMLGCVISGSDDETLYLGDVAEGTYYVGQQYIGLAGTVYSMTLEVSESFGIGYISGRVTDAQTGLGVEGIYVELYDQPFDWDISRPFITTDADGFYKVGYTAGNYTVRFNLQNWYHREYWAPDVNYIGRTYNNGEILELVPGTNVTDANVALEPGGTITGRITDPDGNGIYNALVSACMPGVALISSGYSVAANGYTDEDGYYTADRMRTGNYKVRFRPTNWTQDIQFGTQWYNDTGTFADGEPVPVQTGTITSGIDAQLRETAYIEGHVTNSQGDPIRDIQVTAYDVSGYGIVSAWTGDDGYYYLGNRLPEGDVILYFFANNAQGNYVSEYHTDKLRLQEADPITLQSGQMVFNIDTQLADAGSISGRVTDEIGNGIYNLQVLCSDINSDNYYSAATDSDGFYTIANIAPGFYKIRFRQAVDYALEWYNGGNSSSQAEVITVGAGQTVEGIDAELSPNAGFISGTVTDEFGNGIGDVIVRVFDSSLQGHISSVSTNADGYYSAPGLPTCDVKVNFDTDSNSLNYLMEFYNDKATFEDADLVAAELGQETANIDAVLSPLPDLNITTASLPSGEVAFPFSTMLEVTGGREFYHWSLISGNLPHGLMMNGRGEILGTPTGQGTYNFTVQVTDSSRSQMSDTQSLSLTIDAYSGTDFIISGTVQQDGLPMSGVVMQGLPGNPVAIGGQYIITVPPGWSGTVRPTLAGFYFDPSQRNYTGVAANQPNQDYNAHELTMTVTTEYLPYGMVEKEYNQNLTVEGGTGSYSWTFVSGTLPYGLTLHSDGTISGTPTNSDWYDFTVRVTDSDSPPQTIDKEYSMYIIWEGFISDAPVLYWKLDDTSGNTAKDSSGMNISGILYDNAAFTADSLEGNAVETSGRGWAEAETWRGEFCFANEATIMAYIKIDDLNLDRTVWTFRNDRDGVGWPFYLDVTLKINQNILSLESANGFNVGYDNCPHFNLDVDLSTNPGGFGTGAYHQIAVSIKNNLYKIYINGTEVQSGTGAPFEVYDYVSNFLLMGSDWAESYLNGKADEVMVFNKALEPSEVLSIFNAGPMPAISGNISYSNGNPVSWVWMQGFPGNAYTDDNGNYTVAVPIGWSGTVTPDHWSGVMQPSSRSYTNVTDDIAGENYTVNEYGSLRIITSSWLPDGAKNTEYGPISLTATQGVEPYSWSLASGTWPQGLDIVESTPGSGIYDAIGGTPSEAGNFTFTVSVTDSSSPQQGATKEFYLSISAQNQGFWTTTYPGGGNIHAAGLAIEAADPNVIVATAENRGIFKTTDAGDHWTNLLDDPEWPYGETDYRVFQIHHSSGNYYTSSGGRIYMSTDNGDNWSQIYERENWDISTFAVDPNDTDIIYVGTWEEGIFKTTDGGQNWTASTTDLSSTQILVIRVSQGLPTTVYAGTSNGVYKSSDNGVSWILINNNVDFDWIQGMAIDPVDKDTLYALAKTYSFGDGVFKSIDGGVSWEKKSDTNFSWFVGDCIVVDPSNPLNVYAATYDSILKSSDGGSNWTEYTVSSDVWIRAILIDPANSQNLYAGTVVEGVFKSTDGGLNWTAVNNGIRALSGGNLEIDESNSSFIYSGSNGGGYRSLDGGASWEKMDFPEGSISAILTHPDTSGTVYAVRNRFWKRTYDVNGSWLDPEWIDPTDPQLSGYPDLDLATAAGASEVLYLAVSGAAGWDAGVRRSENGGVTWTIKNDGLYHEDISAIAVHPTDSQTVFVGTQYTWPPDPEGQDGLYKTTDGGDTWVHKSTGLPGPMYIRSIVICANDPNFMYMMGSADNFCGMFKSDDAGESWVEVNNWCPNAIAVAPGNPDILYAGDWSGFNVSLNGGIDWMPFNDGLPRNPEINAIHLDPSDPYHVFITTGAGVYEATFVFDFMILTESLPNGYVGEAYSFALEAAGGSGNYTWEILSGELPDGLSMDSSGNVSGTPTTSGYYDFRVKATDSSDPSLTYQKNVNINISYKYTLNVSTSPAEGGTVTKDPDQSYYIEGDYVDVSVTVNGGYFFTGWTGDATGTSTTIQVSMVKDKILTANFALIGDVPDYYINAFSAPDTASAGDVIGGSVTATVENLGGADSYLDEIAVGIYLSQDSTITSSDILLWKGRSTISALSGGGTVPVTIDPELQIPTTTSGGTYYIGVLVDEYNVIAETNENNNYSSESIAINSTTYDQLELLGIWHGGSSNALACDEPRDLVYVGNGALFQVLDVSDPSHPVKIGELAFEDLISDIDLDLVNNYAYLACSGQGLVIVDITYPTNPQLAGYNDSPQSARAVEATGNYAYITDHFNQGLRTFDVSDPASPFEVHFLPFPGRTKAIAHSGNYLFVTAASWLGPENPTVSLRIIDITDPANPTQTDALSEPMGVTWPEVYGDYLYLPTTNSGLHIYDISNAPNFSEIAVYDGVQRSNFIRVVDEMAYLSDSWNSSIVVLNISDFQNIYEVGRHWLHRGMGLNSMDVAGNYCYANGCFDLLEILDVSDPEWPHQIGTYDAYEGILQDVDISGDYAYLTSFKGTGGGKFRILDISDPTAIVEHGKFFSPSGMYCVKVYGDIAYVLTGDGKLEVLDISDPSNPHEVSVLDNFNDVQEMKLTGQFMFVSDPYSGLKIYDISTPANPIHVSTYPVQNYVRRIFIQGTYAYLTTWRGLSIIDISDPMNPWEVGAYEEDDFYAYELAVQGDYAYVEDSNDYRLKVIDVSDPQNPMEVSTYEGLPYRLEDIEVSGSIVFLASLAPGFIVMDFSDPQNPVVLDERGWFTSTGIEIRENRIYAINRDAGLFVYEFRRQ